MPMGWSDLRFKGACRVSSARSAALLAAGCGLAGRRLPSHHARSDQDRRRTGRRGITAGAVRRPHPRLPRRPRRSPPRRRRQRRPRRAAPRRRPPRAPVPRRCRCSASAGSGGRASHRRVDGLGAPEPLPAAPAAARVGEAVYPNINVPPAQPGGTLLPPDERAKMIAELEALANASGHPAGGKRSQCGRQPEGGRSKPRRRRDQGDREMQRPDGRRKRSGLQTAGRLTIRDR